MVVNIRIENLYVLLGGSSDRHEDEDKFVERQPSTTVLDTNPMMAEHEVRVHGVTFLFMLCTL